MDTYLEFMIKQKYTFVKILAVVMLYILATVLSLGVLVVAISSPVIMQFSVFIMAIFYFGAWWISKKLCVEYEYIVTNDELDVDRIIAKNTRKRLLTVSVKKFEEFGIADDEILKKKDPSIKVILDASIGKDSFNRYYAIFYNKKGEKMLLVFNPTGKMLDLFKIYNPRVINI